MDKVSKATGLKPRSNAAFTFLLEKLQRSPDSTFKLYANWLMKAKSNLIEHLQDKEKLISTVFKTSFILLLLLKKSNSFRLKILFTQEFQPTNNWMTFIDKLNSLCSAVENNNNSIPKEKMLLATQLLLMLHRELTLNEKDYQPFWTPAYNEISEKLLLPTGTDFVALDSNSSNNWSLKQEVKSSFLAVQRITNPSGTIGSSVLMDSEARRFAVGNLQNKSLLTTCSPSSMSFPVDKWEKDPIQPAKLKTLKVKIYPTHTVLKI